MSIKTLQNHVDFLKKAAETSHEQAKQKPEDGFLKALARAHEEVANKKFNELQQALEQAAGQHLSIRLTGPKADGSIRLDDFVKIFSPFIEAIKKASSLAMYGTTSLKMKEELKTKLNQELSFRLRGLSFGSTTLHFSVPALEDATGQSVLSDVLNRAFDLLNEENNEAFLEKIDSIGGGAAHALRDSLKAINNSGYGAIIEWNRPGGVSKWEGTGPKILRAQELLGSLSEPEIYNEKILGTVASLKDTGLIEIRTKDCGKVNVRYAMNLVPEVQKLKVSAKAELVVSTKKSWDAGGKKFIFHRRLLACSVSE